LSRRIAESLTSLVPKVLRPHVRTVGAGFAFGTVLFAFAFGTMGMISPERQTVREVMRTEQVAQGIERPRWNEWQETAQPLMAVAQAEREATHADLVNCGNLILKVYQTLAQTPGLDNRTEGDGARYLAALGTNWSPEEPLKREDAAIFLFKLLGDLFDVAPPDRSTIAYQDIPRFHYLNIPVETLEQLGLQLGRAPKMFGAGDRVTVGWLQTMMKPMYRVCEARLKVRQFPSLDVN